MVVEQVERVAAGAHGYSHCAGVVVLAHGRAVVALVIVADVDGGGAAHGGFDALAISVVDVGRADAAARDAGHVVLRIVGQGDILAAVDASSLIMVIVDSPVHDDHDESFSQSFSQSLLVILIRLFEGVD